VQRDTSSEVGSTLGEVLGEPYMTWLIRTLRLPASESHANVILAICLFAMSVMSVAIVWQAAIIANQRDAIRWLEAMKFMH
jgi:hypothetical protein